ncbi:hypothetical protein [Neptuniibacter sp. QD37_11]|uniref:hypothetical protein n=1 Tax=Neptuniibacter sp. QD37_11 TaxID=3398209 RepID=UPI0039F5F956
MKKSLIAAAVAASLLSLTGCQTMQGLTDGFSKSDSEKQEATTEAPKKKKIPLTDLSKS